jgi:bifunctional DNA-binding transcriptional regulator/antitoxin component of YhaV-PrlF toxin-antitoxin module
MVKILHSTSRGQITLPKEWRDNFDTDYYRVEIQAEKLVIVPLNSEKTFKDKVEESWGEYQRGGVVSHEDLKKKYGL